ncbi:unnamed protein product [Periconia digitata]|uniref:Uncharacterized protein n=1 Tax=Periconia digitata TaxID=1303443 RepID=A0A9W4UVH8_9PLEO|nr:unnamed protein product [Periconia digitata]
MSLTHPSSPSFPSPASSHLFFISSKLWSFILQRLSRSWIHPVTGPPGTS